MKKVFKIGVCAGIIASQAGCGTSEHFMQDDVYNTRTPVMPVGTDLNDVTDYAAFVAKKEQTQTQERTTYVSPRDYRDYFYYSQFMYYRYSPFAMNPGLNYYGYQSSYSGFGNGFYSSIGFGNYYGYNPYGYNPYGGYYGYPYHSSGYYDPYWNSPYYNNYYYGNYYGGNYYGYGGGYYGGSYTQKGKPNTGGNLANIHAGTSAGRMGSSSNGEIISYPHKMLINPATGTASSNTFNGIGRNTSVRGTDGLSPATMNSGRGVVSPATGRVSVNRPEPSVRPVVSTPRTDYHQSGNPNTNYNPNTRTRTFDNTSTPVRTSTPTFRNNGGSSGGGGGGTGSGVRTGVGRR
ncbi:hypothetical protein [Fluviicola sp.]|jgi:hypothetical protein|uniref:hypothetical protein n=1 Tax=Fluviicola sp. TaxID=1917219 RepID=UPI002829B756|nr:hypothetical protein [Fluviicola sp.]MDR0801992.1 hypothetical protein [Fluviicola sp.]